MRNLALLASLLLLACGDDSSPDTARADASSDARADAARDTSAADTALDAPGLDAPGSDAPGLDAADASEATGPAGPGAFAVSTRDATVMRMGRTTPVVAHVPAGDAMHPLVVFAPGFQLQSAFYAPLCERLASHGFVVVRADPEASLLSANHVSMRDDLIAVIDWALADSELSPRIDAEQIGVFGHSLGGKLSTMVAIAEARVTALLGIDPVDGGGGFGGMPAATPDIVPSESMGLRIPVGFLGETTNGAGGFMPCAPSDQNFQRFYESATMSAWAAEWDFAGADHMDFVPDTSSCGFTCSACTAGTADVATVLAGTYTLTVAFFRRHLQADAAMDATLLATPPVGVTVRSR